MALKLHLHANLPHDIDKPNAALGYLKSFLSSEKVDITNIYWYLMPKKLVDLISSILLDLKSQYIHDSQLVPYFTAYISRFFYRTHSEYTAPTVLEALLSSCTSREKVENAARILKDFVDYSIETRGMADVDIAGFTVKMYQWILNPYIWCRLKEQNPNITIVVGGLDSQSEAVTFLKTFKDVDYAVWGGGEIPLRELINHHDDSALNEVPRLVYRDKSEISTPDSSEHTIVYPFADHTDYFKQLKKFDLTFPVHIPVISTRSCLWNRCKFCSLNRGTYYERPVEDIISEIEFQSKKYDIDTFIFPDSDIGRRNTDDFVTLLKALLESTYKRRVPYMISAEVSPLRLSRKNVEMMSRIRMAVQIGFEAVTDTLLEKMDKKHRVAENLQALKFGNDYAMVLGGLNVLRNLPGECEGDVLESMENLKFFRFFLKKYPLILSELTLYKGARYYEEIGEEERRKRWVQEFVYSEMEKLGIIAEEDKWEFFGFRACDLMHHLLWNQFEDLLERLQSGTITYRWLEFPDGTSLIEEQNSLNGDKAYVLDRVETDILKFCDSITHMNRVEKEFPHKDTKQIISQLREENLLYVDERKRLISIPSVKTLERIEIE